MTEIKQYNLTDTPWYFGAYFNMARHNIYLISNKISDKFNLSKLGNEEDISGSFLVNKDTIEKNGLNLLYTSITRFIPVIKVFSSDLLTKELKEEAEFQGVDIDKTIHFLKLAFEELNAFRNDYSHFYLANGAKRKISIGEDFAIYLRKLFAYAISYTKVRFKDVFPENSFNLVENIIFNQLIDENNIISIRGLVFFCNLFLDKENAFHFFNKVTGFKDTRTYDFLATREVFTVFCVKLPHDKFVSDDSDQALQLDILNYLNRVPMDLHNALTESGKKQFQPHLDKLTKGNIAENSIGKDVKEEDYEKYIEAISTLKRNEDRFTEFALKYLDKRDTFNFHFQIHLGKSKIKSYKKSVLGDSPNEDNRAIIKDIKTFGKLSTFLDESEEVKEKIVEEKDFKKLFVGDNIEYFTQYAPKYNIKNNKIGMVSLLS
jgi:hypothetical protein